MGIKKHGFLLIICLLLLSACTSTAGKEQQIESFTFTNQEGQPFGMEQLENSVWIADFIFTTCTTVCLPMTTEMAALQEKFKELDLQVEFVSFTVDPINDSPEVLRDYVQNFTTDLSNWNLLTGYSQEDIEVFARDHFKTIVQKPDASDQVIHSSNFYLVDRQGRLVDEYNHITATYVEDLLRDVQSLLAK